MDIVGILYVYNTVRMEDGIKFHIIDSQPKNCNKKPMQNIYNF